MSIFRRMIAALGRRDAKIERAIAELSAYSDADLADLGISRGEIRHVVLHGRPGIDRPRAALTVVANDVGGNDRPLRNAS